MNHSLKTRVLSLVLALVMVVGVMPVLSYAAGATANGLPEDMAMVSDKVSTLAPGIVERQITAYDKNGDRVLLYVATADPTVDTVKVYANYMDNQNQVWGMQKTTEQAAAFEANHEGENVVVAINGSYFNTTNGAPSGAFVMEGVDASNNGNNYSFFALLKDGTYMIGAKGEYNSYKGQIQEAIGGYIHLVQDGKILVNPDNDKYPRQTIGLTAEGKVIIMTADCLSAVGSAGLTVYEQAQVMLSLGCVEAIHLDGGGSGTYCSKQAGSDKLEVTNNPSNGTERAVSSTLILVSTAKPDGEFDSAQLTAEHEYVTPGSSVAVSAVGLDSSKGAAEIPADVSWQVADSALGTVENGVFASSGLTGDAVVQMVYGGKVVGQTTVHVVNPDKIDFGGRASVIIPNESTVDLPVKAYYGVNPVHFNVSDFEVALGNAAVTVSGLSVTAPDADSGVTGTTVTVSLKADKTVSFSASLVFGKASDVLFDFEEGTLGADIDNWILRTHEYNDDRYNEKGDIKIVTAETGKVHSGDQALAFHTDFSQLVASGSTTTGYCALSISWGGDAINVKGAQKMGFWVYIPEGAVATEFTMNTVYYDANGTAGRRTVDCADDNGELIYTPYWSTKMEGSGWQYVEADFSAYKNDLLIKDEPSVPKGYKNNFLIKIYCVSGKPTADLADFRGDFTFYIDDITVDYSTAVEDRKLPVFGDCSVNGSGSTKALVYGQTVELAENSLTFNANVADNTTDDNYVGLDASTAKIYVDGHSVGAAYTNGMISSSNVVLADGYHRVTFEIADNNGNVKAITREINVNAGSDKATVALVPRDASLDRLLSGSVYWADLVSDNIANIKSLEAVLQLNSNSIWELDNMIVADGFTASWSYASGADKAENIVTLTVSRNGEALDPDNTVIASLPIRIWESLLYTNKTHKDKTPAAQWAAKAINHRLMSVKVQKGQVTFADDSTALFSGKIVRDHEGYEDGYLLDTAYWTEKNANGGFHTHTAVALEDLAATCTDNGYTGRTFCEGCNSAVEWGTTIAATGHSYGFADGVLKCACGELFNGVYTDGKLYVDGLTVTDGWNGDSYYVDGVKLTGVQNIDGYYYNFGEDGICAGQAKFSGLFYDEAVSAYRYAKIGEPQSGWVQIEGKWHYFDATTKTAVTGDYYYASRGVTYHFDETGMTEGAWQKTKDGIRYWYGQWYYKAIDLRVCFVEIDGKTYNFDENGYLTTGIHALYYDWTHHMRCEMDVWEFDENGVLVGQITDKGLVDNKRGGMYLVEEDGFVHGGKEHVASYNGDLYFVCHSGKLKQNGTHIIKKSNSNGLLEPGTYYFGADGKLFTGVKEDADGLYYYKNGQVGKGIYNSELAEIDGQIYLVKWSGKVAVSEPRDITAGKSNGLLPAGTYFFGADGKLFIGTGVVWNANDQLYYYYKNGQLGNKQYNSELAEIDGKIYLVKWSGKVAFNETREIPKSKANGLLAAGTYYFGADAQLYTGIKEESDGLLYYYTNGQIGKKLYNSELAEINGQIYLVKWSGKIAFNETRVIPASKTNGLLAAGTYYFGADGKLFTGVMADADGVLCFYENGQMAQKVYKSELVEVNGDIYLVKWSGKVAVNETREIDIGKANGLVEAGTYTFGADGKLQA